MDLRLWRAALAWESSGGTGHPPIPDQQLWQLRTAGRKGLIERMRNRHQCQLAAEGADPSNAAGIFDDNVLTLGFARRFATYKRPQSSPARYRADGAAALQSAMPRPVNPCGEGSSSGLPGQDLIKQWRDYVKRPEEQGRVSVSTITTRCWPRNWSRESTSGSTHLGAHGRPAEPVV